MTVSEALEKISKALAVLAYQTQAENLAGMFSKNRLTEDLLLPVFKLTLKAPDLRNINQTTTNFPYVDLVDDTSQLAIQVTTERTAAKVTDTLKMFLTGGYDQHYKRLIFFVLTENKLQYATKTKKHWRTLCGSNFCFDPKSDILTTLDLFRLIQGLPYQQIYDACDLLSRSVCGDAFIDVESFLSRQSCRQLNYEKESGKYIPDIFVETQKIKDLARIFAHPLLFLRRTLGSLERLNIQGVNRFLEKAGLPPFEFPTIRQWVPPCRLGEIEASVAELSVKLKSLADALGDYESVSDDGPPPFPIRKEREHFYQQNTYTLQNIAGSLRRRIQNILNGLTASRAKVFILTGRAGQGKTNFVCDFVENFLWKHRIPCSYFSARKLCLLKGSDLGEAIFDQVFEGQTTSFAEAARHISLYADRTDKPFILVLDGLNEHNRISEFAEQLEHLIERTIEHPHLKLLLTCRSEFFQERFGTLVTGPVSPYVFVESANDQILDPACYDQILAGYFEFYRVRRELIADQVVDSLKCDILLLRFFCEAYGSRGKPKDYAQPFIRNAHREQIFGIYLEQKLGSADIFLRRITRKHFPVDPKADLRAVIAHAVKHMLTAWNFSDVPISIIPQNLHEALYALLDEELIIRRDISTNHSIFSQPTETINFTFDEFRDFLIAQYLIYLFQTVGEIEFERYLTRGNAKDSQMVEGVKKFLFYGSRRTEQKQFWTFYHTQAWYTDVYENEVFNIEPTLLNNEDREIVLNALDAGGNRAQTLARRLAPRWHRDSYPFLNLDLLLSSVKNHDDAHYETLVLAQFKTDPFFDGRSIVDEYCEFTIDQILPQFDPATDDGVEVIFKFLVLLIPADTAASREIDRIFHHLLENHPVYLVDLLRQMLQFKPSLHRRYVWRLLASASKYIARDDSLLREAQADMNRLTPLNTGLRYEATCFIKRFSEDLNS